MLKPNRVNEFVKRGLVDAGIASPDPDGFIKVIEKTKVNGCSAVSIDVCALFGFELKLLISYDIKRPESSSGACGLDKIVMSHRSSRHLADNVPGGTTA